MTVKSTILAVHRELTAWLTHGPRRTGAIDHAGRRLLMDLYGCAHHRGAPTDTQMKLLRQSFGEFVAATDSAAL